ncbi:MAG: RNA recognition motif domain-containing protein [Candidatus Sericytochromatia bacterium]
MGITMKIFVGNLAAEASEEELKQASEAFGEVAEVTISRDEQGQSKGFGFVEMSSKAEAEALLSGLNGKEIKGQAVKLSEARPDKRGGKAGQAWSGPVGGRGSLAPKSGGGKGNSKAGFKAPPKTTGHNKV